jgi:cell division inhibitor SepF
MFSMADRLKRAAAWLGLVTDDRYADYDDHEADEELTEGLSRDQLPTEAAANSASVTQLETKRPAGATAIHTGATAISGATAVPTGATAIPTPSTPPTPRTADMSRIITVHPRTYNEARVIGEHFRDGVPVIMNLSEMEDVDAKRLVDFAAGLIFGLRGTIERVTSKVFLLSPPNVNVTAEDKERIAGGFFNQS